jgi:branched-chain amino acid transport system permease protein
MRLSERSQGVVKDALPWVLLAAAVALPWVAQALDQAFYIGVARRILIFALAAASLNLILGFGGLVSLGHAAFFGVGAYTAGIYFIMITLAFAQMVYYVAIGLKTYGGEDGLSLPGKASIGAGIDLTNDTAFYYVVLALFAASMFVLNRLVDARFGRALIGVRENESRMEAIGFATYRLRLVAFVIAGALAGLAGALFANHNSFVSPTVLHWTQSATLVIMVILGGIGYRYGGLYGAAALLLLEEVLSMYTEYWHLALGVLLLVVVFAAPQGLAGLLTRRTH